MALSLDDIDRIFERLTATYGRDFTGRWEGVHQNAVKSSWMHELAGFADKRYAVHWALDNLPERAINVIEFRNLCRHAPGKAVPRLPQPAGDPVRMASAVTQIRSVLTEKADVKPGPKDWARRVLQRRTDGEKLSPGVVAMARAALGGVGLQGMAS